MSTMWRNILVYLGLVEEPEEHDEYERSRRGERAREERRAPGRSRRAAVGGEAGRRTPGRENATSSRGKRGAGSVRERAGADDRARQPDGANVRSLRSARDRPAHVRPVDAGLIRVGIVRANDFDDAEKVGERYRTGQPVLLDLGEVDSRTGRRLLDFVSGLIYALRGRIKPAGGRAFLLLPDGVDVPKEERRRLADLGYHVEPTPPAEA